MTSINKNYYKYLFFTFLGFLIVCFIIWNRLLRDRFARDLILYRTNSFLFYLVCFIIFLFTCLSVSAYVNLKKAKNLNETKNTIIQEMILKLKQTKIYFIGTSLVDSPKIFYDFLMKHTDIEGFIAYFAEVILYKVIVIFAGKNKAPFYIIFVLIPRLIVIIIFYVDIFVYNQLYYFYKFLVLLLIPIMFYSIIYMTKTLCDKNIYFFMLHLNYENIGENNVRITFKEEQPKIEGAFDITDVSLLPYIVELLNTYGDIKNFFIRLEEKELEIKLYEQLIFSSAYLVGWLSVLYIAFSTC